MQHPRPTAFINVLAWLFIVLAGIGILTGLLQNLAIYFWPPLVEVLEQTRQQETVVAPGSGWWHLVMSNLRWVLAFNLLASILVFAAAVGLLHRRNWARLAFVLLLAIVVLFTLANLAFALQTVFSGTPAGTPADSYAPAMHAARGPSVLAGMLFSLLLCVLFAWVIWQLCRAEVAEQFHG